MVKEIGQGNPPTGAASVKWPGVPACFGWLSLDRRGGWRLKGEPIRHAGLIDWINHNYAPDADGQWIFRNGPQAVFVDLEYTPLVLRLDVDDSLVLHTGQFAGVPTAAYLDEEGNVLIEVDPGIGLLDDRDLAGFIGGCRGPDEASVTEELLAAASFGDAKLTWRGLVLRNILRRDVSSRFRFNPAPQAVQQGS